MGFIARRLIKQNLNLLDVLVEDENNSFFNVVEVPTTFTSGRSSFKIFGSQFLKQTVPLQMEMLDTVGNTVYIAPVDLVGEEVSPFLPYRYITVEAYRPPVNVGGLALITIVGEIDPNTVTFDIPTQYQDTYNVRYTKRVNLDVSTVINTQPILFYKNPTIVTQELVKANIVNTEVTQSTRIFTSGSGLPRADLKDKVIKVSSGSQVQDDGIKEITKANKDLESKIFDFAIEVGADDITSDDENQIIYCKPEQINKIKEKISTLSIEPLSVALTWISSSKISIDGDEAKKLFHLIDQLEDNEDVQSISSNYDVSDDFLNEINN